VSITAKAPEGGTVAELGGKSRPLLLRISEIERFEAQHSPLGIYEIMSQLLPGGYPQARHCRDLMALGLVGAGESDAEADRIVSELGPADLIQIRTVTQSLVFAAFAPTDTKKKGSQAGSSDVTPPPQNTTPKA
jgi:hypothetical protein